MKHPYTRPQVEQYRIRKGRCASDPSDGNNGAFLIPSPTSGTLTVIISDGSDWQECKLPGEPWEHVSVSQPNRCPNWVEMDFIKRLFWNDEETVVQFHVPRSQWINNHNYCLHLWKPTGQEIALPPALTVGYAKQEDADAEIARRLIQNAPLV